jgi:hypothetical protein
MVPRALGDFYEANSGFDHASCNEAFATEPLGFLAVESIEFFGLFAFGLDIENLGKFRLHAISHLVGADNSFDFLIPGIILKFLLKIQAAKKLRIDNAILNKVCQSIVAPVAGVILVIKYKFQ